MRYLVAILAALALLVNPVAATAAQFACDHGGMAQDSMVVPGIDHQQADMPMSGSAREMAATPAAGDPCCDHSGGQKTDDRNCAQACATMCAVLVALPYTPTAQLVTWTRVPAPPTPAIWPHSHDPSGLERPPKSIT